MYALNPSGVPTIRDHADAARVYETLKLFPPRYAGTMRDRGKLDGRPLNAAARNLGHMSLRMTYDGDYAVRYHATDVVTYHEDGSLTLDAWCSMSTNALCHALLPDEVYTDYSSGRGEHAGHGALVWLQASPVRPTYFTWDDGKPSYINRPWSGNFQAYLVPSRGMRFRRDAEGYYKPVGPCDAIDFPRVDRAALDKACREYRLSDFVAFCGAINTGAFGELSSRELRYAPRINVATALLNPEMWRDLFAQHAHRGALKEAAFVSWSERKTRRPVGTFCPAKFRAHMRLALGRALGLIVTDELPCLDDRKHYDRWRKASRTLEDYV